jgi:hypothetical protein
MNTSKGLTGLGCLGWAIVIFSLFFVAASVTELITGPAAGTEKPTEPGVLVGLLVFFGGAAYGGWRLANSNNKAPLSQNEREQRVLTLAAANNGRVTVAEVALRCAISVDEAKATLLHLVNTGVAETWLSEGEAVYVFAGLEDETKAAAQDPFRSS